MNLIINADDLGYSKSGDECIFRCFQHGLVTSASLLVTGVSAITAIQKAVEIQLPAGLHLNLTEGMPVTLNPLQQIPSLVDSLSGKFLGKIGFRNAQHVRKEHVVLEVIAQIERFKLLHPNHQLPTHVDGHQHCHISPNVVDGIIQAFVQCGITKTRLPLEYIVAPWVVPTSRMEFYERVNQDSLLARDLFIKNGIWFPNYFIGKSLMGYDCTLDRLRVFLMMIPRSRNKEQLNHYYYYGCYCCEWMVHPAQFVKSSCIEENAGFLPNNEGPDDFAQSQERLYEEQNLCQDDFKQLIQLEEQFQLTSFQSIHGINNKNGTTATTTNPSIPIIASCNSLSGNLFTALRFRYILCEYLNWTSFIIDTNLLTTTTSTSLLRQLLEDEHTILAFGLHALRAGNILDQQLANKIPYILILGGTDVNNNTVVTNNSVNDVQIMQSTLTHARAVVAFNRQMAIAARRNILSSLYEIHIIPQSVIIISPNTATNTSHFSLRKMLQLENNIRLIVLPLGVRQVKDPLFLIETVSEQLDGEAMLVIIGPVLDEKLGLELNKACSMTNNVKFIGPLSHSRLIDCMREADVVTNSSQSEGMSNALLEAMALGEQAVVIVRRNEGNSSLVIDGVTGLLYDTPQQFVEYFRQLFGSNQHRLLQYQEGGNNGNSSSSLSAKQLVHAAKIYVEKKFNLKNEVLSYSKLINGVIGV
jgi:hypothetical protein